MKIHLTILLSLMCIGKIFAQDIAINRFKNVVNALKAQDYDKIQTLTDPEVTGRLTPGVFAQVREVFLRRNNLPTRYVEPSPKDSITRMALEMLNRRSTDTKKEGEIEFESVEVVTSGPVETVYGKISKTSLKLLMRFNQAGKLTDFFLEPSQGESRYSPASYANEGLLTEKEIMIRTGNFVLPGVLTVPQGKKGFPVVIFVHGSGPGSRDEQIASLKPFRDIAMGLAANGIASIRYDKRTRIYPNAAAPLGGVETVAEETTLDASSAIQLALTIQGADKKKIFVIGHSMGGMITPRIVQENPLLAGAIILSGPARPMDVSFRDQIMKLKELNDAQRTVKLQELDLIPHADTIKAKSSILADQTVAFWEGLNHYKQLEEVTKIKQPLFIIQGGGDYMVPASDLDLWKNATRNKKNAVTKLYPDLNHFYTANSKTQTVKDYYIPANVPGYVIEDISKWINAVK
ncbi:alpha/beta hydrolase family protein [Pedobacter miscanthi]|uniref:Serine aminopeptidase S33 domain-containing protein n=1 Tax=Pedobacter miscanthi TaxID=2259170 RepID=A0A366LEZ8_9SPHI|nr:alpha/beta fold hydrolase [Pedobacter miscanthi]RBQ12059.1 hypothetical protein DRW42_02030 [Pedobacter miscanthi]